MWIKTPIRRNYVTVDIIQRILTDYFGIPVFHTMGMTDIDDKIINRAKESGKSADQLAVHFEQEFLSDMDALGVQQHKHHINNS